MPRFFQADMRSIPIDVPYIPGSSFHEKKVNCLPEIAGSCPESNIEKKIILFTVKEKENELFIAAEKVPESYGR